MTTATAGRVMTASSLLPSRCEGASANRSGRETICGGEPVNGAWTTSAISGDAYEPGTRGGTRIIPIPAVLIARGGTSKNWTDITRPDVDLIDALVEVRPDETATPVAHPKELGPISRPAEAIHSARTADAGV